MVVVVVAAVVVAASVVAAVAAKGTVAVEVAVAVAVVVVVVVVVVVAVAVAVVVVVVVVVAGVGVLAAGGGGERKRERERESGSQLNSWIGALKRTQALLYMGDSYSEGFFFLGNLGVLNGKGNSSFCLLVAVLIEKPHLSNPSPTFRNPPLPLHLSCNLN